MYGAYDTLWHLRVLLFNYFTAILRVGGNHAKCGVSVHFLIKFKLIKINTPPLLQYKMIIWFSSCNLFIHFLLLSYFLKLTLLGHSFKHLKIFEVNELIFYLGVCVSAFKGDWSEVCVLLVRWMLTSYKKERQFLSLSVFWTSLYNIETICFWKVWNNSSVKPSGSYTFLRSSSITILFFSIKIGLFRFSTSSRANFGNLYFLRLLFISCGFCYYRDVQSIFLEFF